MYFIILQIILFCIKSRSLLKQGEYEQDVVESVRTICGFDAARNDWRLPTQALRMGFWLKTCASILHTEALAACDSEREKQAEDFLTLYRKEWSDEVAFRARRVIRERKLNKPQPLPLTEDLQQLQAYLKRRATACIDMLRKQPSNVSAYQELSQVALCQTVLFNRRR
jgi:hypothetical protein